MVDFLLRNWFWIFFIVAMVGMHLGGHQHGGHGGQRGLMGGCGAGHRSHGVGDSTVNQTRPSESRSEGGRTGATGPQPQRLPDPSRDTVPDPTRDADPAWWGSTSHDNPQARTDQHHP